MPLSAFVDFTSQFEYGLKLPDGREIWPPDQFYGHTFQTVGDRATLSTVLQAAVDRLGMSASALDEFQWLVREHRFVVTRYLSQTVSRAIDDPDLVIDPDAVNTEVEAQVEEVTDGQPVEPEWVGTEPSNGGTQSPEGL